jgi:hypothetical protein
MNSLTAAELKRRGMAAIEEGLRKGPVHLVKHNKPAAVRVAHGLRTPDALQAASCLQPAGEHRFVAGDAGFKKVSGLSCRVLR